MKKLGEGKGKRERQMYEKKRSLSSRYEMCESGEEGGRERASKEETEDTR